MLRCTNECFGIEECTRLDCCHNCALFVRAKCHNDGTRAFLPRYFSRGLLG